MTDKDEVCLEPAIAKNAEWRMPKRRQCIQQGHCFLIQAYKYTCTNLGLAAWPHPIKVDLCKQPKRHNKFRSPVANSSPRIGRACGSCPGRCSATQLCAASLGGSLRFKRLSFCPTKSTVLCIRVCGEHPGFGENSEFNTLATTQSPTNPPQVWPVFKRTRESPQSLAGWAALNEGLSSQEISGGACLP